MTPQQKLIEYYFYHYQDFDFETSTNLSKFQKTLFPSKTDSIEDRPWDKRTPDSTTLFMGHIIQSTYRYFSGTKKELLKQRYFQRMERSRTCKKLKISARTYHRYLKEIISYAEFCIKQLQNEQLEFEKQVMFFEKIESNTPENKLFNNNEYFSNYSQL